MWKKTCRERFHVDDEGTLVTAFVTTHPKGCVTSYLERFFCAWSGWQWAESTKYLGCHLRALPDRFAGVDGGFVARYGDGAVEVERFRLRVVVEYFHAHMNLSFRCKDQQMCERWKNWTWKVVEWARNMLLTTRELKKLEVRILTPPIVAKHRILANGAKYGGREVSAEH